MMLELQLILTGVGLGILISAPVGPVNVICIQRTLERGFVAGVLAGLGAVLADGVIAVAAASGIRQISGAMTRFATEVQLIGGIVLLLFGGRLYQAASRMVQKSEHPKRAKNTAYRWTVPQTFLLTITNPGAILGMFAIVGGAGSALGGLSSYVEAFTLVLSIMGGAMLWWIGLARVIATLRHRLNARKLIMINRIAGAILIGFGGLLIVRAAFGFGASAMTLF